MGILLSRFKDINKIKSNKRYPSENRKSRSRSRDRKSRSRSRDRKGGNKTRRR